MVERSSRVPLFKKTASQLGRSQVNAQGQFLDVLAEQNRSQIRSHVQLQDSITSVTFGISLTGLSMAEIGSISRIVEKSHSLSRFSRM